MNNIEQEWIDINLKLRLKLKELEKLDKERKRLMNKPFNDSIKDEMNKSVQKYQFLLEEIQKLNNRAQELSKTIDN